MRKVFALCMITVACIVSTTACGAGNSTNRAGSDTSDSVREITVNESSKSAETAAEENKNGNSAGTKKSYAKITSDAKLQSFGGTVKLGGSAYELYNYVEKSASNYASVVNTVASRLKGKADVYDLVVPTSMGITFPDNETSKVNSSDQKKSIHSINKKMNHQVKTVP